MKDPYSDAEPSNWVKYLKACGQYLLIFFLATFAMVYYFRNYGNQGTIWTLVVGGLYLLIVVGSGIRMVKKLSMSALMIASPTIPLCMMILVVSLLPIFQFLDKHSGRQANLVKEHRVD